MRRPVAVLAIIAALIVVADPLRADDGGRIAWVIGNAGYEELPRVGHAIDDARAVADALQLAGFEIRDAYDTREAELRDIWHDIYQTVGAGGCIDCVFYFSGHAKADGPEQYFLPVEFGLRDPIEFQVSFKDLILFLNAHESDAGASVLLLDVGRTPSRSRGISFLNFDMSATTVSRTALMFSYRSDTMVPDGPEGTSPFARALVKQLQRPGLELGAFYREVAADVREATGGATWPRLIGTLPRAFHFHPPDDGDGRFSNASAELRSARVLVEHEDGRLVPTYTSSHALLIGASDYENEAAWYDLPGVQNDIEQIGKALAERHGFEVIAVDDPTKAELEKALADFAVNQGADENARLVIYYAGHGHTLGTPPLRTGWVVPVDAPDPAQDPSGFFQTALSMDEIRKYSLIINAKHVLWVFDSCFSGQLIETLRGTPADKWESFLQTGKVRRVITSGSADQRVPDRSVFASYFAAALEGRLQAGGGSGLVTGNQLSHFLKGRVIADRGAAQTPQYGTIKLFGADEGDIIFRVEPPG